MKWNRINTLAILALAAALLGTAAWLAWPSGRQPGTLVLSGNIEAHESVLSFKTIQSRIVELPFLEGQRVSRGSVLALVDDTDYRQQLAIAQGNLELQQRQLEASRQALVTAGRTLALDQAELRQRRLDWQRALELQQQGFTSRATLDQAQTALDQVGAALARDESLQSTAARNVEVAKAAAHNAAEAVALSRIVLGYTQLTAPFDGVVTAQQSELGEVVVPGTPVLTLADLDHVWLRAYLNEADLGRLQLGQQVSVSSDSQPQARYQGRVSFISDKAEFTPKSVETHAERVNLVYRIKIDIANPEHRLLPGMPADARIALPRASPQ